VRVLVNNAGVYLEAPFADIVMDEAVRLLEVNVAGLMCVTRRCLPGVVEAAGMIINMVVERAGPAGEPGGVSREQVRGAGVRRRAAVGAAGSGVRVCTMLPGPVNTWGAG
jgi:NADP-dependent 3-hydroxy acid dehydrogenase YdfG